MTTDALLKIGEILVWPITAIVIILFFRTTFASLINRASSGRVGQLELKFDSSTNEQLLLQIDFLNNLNSDKERTEMLRRGSSILPYISKVSPSALELLIHAFHDGMSYSQQYFDDRKHDFDELENYNLSESIAILVSETENNYVPLLLSDGLLFLKAFGFTQEHLQEIQRKQKSAITAILANRQKAVDAIVGKPITIDVAKLFHG